jgi:hypothetical protein
MNTPQLPLWHRIGQQLKHLADAFDYDSTQYTFDQLDILRSEIASLKARMDSRDMASDAPRCESGTSHVACRIEREETK